MDRYKLTNEARPRSIASVDTNDTAPNVPAGTEFDSDAVQQDIKLASGPLMVQIKTGPWTNKWVPKGMYNGKEFAVVVGEALPPPPTPPSEHILYVKDGVTRRFIPE